jgi:23S rRNA maturation mini-RNase III
MSRVVQVRAVPDEVHDELTQQAREAGLSLNRFLLQELERIARRGRNAEVLRRASRRRGRRLGAAPIVRAVREDRELGR